MKINPTPIVAYLAIAVILISLFFIGAKITGHATDTGVVNVTISTAAALNFTTAILDFGTGSVVTGQTTATLASDGGGTNTSWTGPKTDGELVLENIGNVNVTLSLKASKTPDVFIGGTNPTFGAKVTNTSTHTTSCVGANFTDYEDITESDQIACNPLTYSENDTIDINFNMTIPIDAVGAKTVTITATGTATS